MTTTAVDTIRPISRSEAEVRVATEYVRFVEQLRSLDADDWTKPTDCPLWDVRAVAGHSAGMMSDFTSLRAVVRRVLSATKDARRVGGPLIDSVTALQVADNANMTEAELISRFEHIGPKAAHWRASVPGLFRRIPSKETVGGVRETWRLSYLLDTILTRDPWMHRIDIARATGRDLVLTPDHDGRIVADVVAEWARRHGQPCTLTLTGPAGGEFTAGGGGGEHITIDAVEFCRTLSGRASGSGLLTQEVPF